MAAELVGNGGFTSSGAGWTLFNSPGETASVQYLNRNDVGLTGVAANLSPSPGETNVYTSGLSRSVTLAPNTNYRLRFEAAAGQFDPNNDGKQDPVTINVQVKNGSTQLLGNGGGLVVKLNEISLRGNEYWYEFKTPAQLSGNSTLLFFINGNNFQRNGQTLSPAIYLDSVSIQRSSAGNDDVVTEGEFTNVPVGSASPAWVNFNEPNWNASYKVYDRTDVGLDGNALNYYPSPQRYASSLIHSVTVEPGSSYQLRFRAAIEALTVTTPQIVVQLKVPGSSTPLFTDTFDLSTVGETFSSRYNIPATSPANLQLVFFLGGNLNSAGVAPAIYLDDVSLRNTRYANTALKQLPITTDIDTTVDNWWQDYQATRMITFTNSSGQLVSRAKFLLEPDGFTTNSEYQAIAMMLAASVGDKQVFDQLLRYTNSYIGTRDISQKHAGEDSVYGLMAYEIDANGNETNADAIADADINIAYSLILAADRFGNGGTFNYAAQAQSMLDAIWTLQIGKPGMVSEAVSYSANIEADDGTDYVNDIYFVEAGTFSNATTQYAPLAYASPGVLRVFEEFSNNTTHQWERVANDFYVLLDRVYQSMRTGKTTITIGGVPRDFTGAHPANNGLLYPAWALPTGQSMQRFDLAFPGGPQSGNGDAEQYLHFVNDAGRLPIHLMMDLAWFPDSNRGGQAAKHLDRINTFAATPSSFSQFFQWYDLDGTSHNFLPSGTLNNDSVARNAFATALMRDTDILINRPLNTQASETNENTLRANAWDQVFANYEVNSNLFTDDWRMVSGLMIAGLWDNPLS
jgi:endo-1,4-beta-D-glucanase Y